MIKDKINKETENYNLILDKKELNEEIKELKNEFNELVDAYNEEIKENDELKAKLKEFKNNITLPRESNLNFEDFEEKQKNIEEILKDIKNSKIRKKTEANKLQNFRVLG